MEPDKHIIEKKDQNGETVLERNNLNGEPIPPEETPKERSRFLPVIPSVEPAGLPPTSYLVLAPPPLPMPYGLGVTCENGGEINNANGRVLMAWANEYYEKPIKLNGRPSFTFTRKNEYYAERPFSGEVFGMLYKCLFIAFAFSSTVFFLGPPKEQFLGSEMFNFLFIVSILFLLINSFIIFYNYKNLPTMIFNRMRDEIYIYSGEKKALFIKKYSTATFLLYGNYHARLYLLLEDEKDLQDMENQWVIDGARGLSLMIPTWEYIRRYMAAGEDYKELPLNKSLIHFWIPFLWFAKRLDEKIFSRPHRWPPEIERLLWPENKNAPLPAGWQYNTWIPYDIPQGGFDNSELLRQREEQLQATTEQHAA